ncbi:MAG: hypothetical protein Q7S39_12455 [Ignavibacteria bacterium]|nr:hypothetical protein [Ignavibacteria bacterium]
MEKNKINAVELVRTIRDKQFKELKNTSIEEQKKYYRKKSKLLKSKLSKYSQETDNS